MSRTLPAAIITRNLARCTLTSSCQSKLLTLCIQSSRKPSCHFSTTGPLLKRGGAASKKPSTSDAFPTAVAAKAADKKKGADDASSDPYDFSELQASIARTLDWMKKQIADLRNGSGRSAVAIEELRVSMARGRQETVRLAEVAQVVPRGRVLAVMVGEKEHLKPVLSALNNSPHSLAPTTSPTNPLELHIALPPPTRESRSALIDVAVKHSEMAASGIGAARLAHKKKLRHLELSKKVRLDVLRKAGEEMEKVVGVGTAEVKRLMEGLRKGS